MFGKILIANRGEIAVRVIRACRDMGIVSVAVFSETDRDALHTQLADESVCIGPAPSKDSYLNTDRIISAALASRADAIHPGYGYLSENAAFAEQCAKYGLTFIGPSPEALLLLGDKARAVETARNAGVPVVPGSNGTLNNADEARKLAKEIGFPLMLKAAAGGGGRGIRLLNGMSELSSAFSAASAEAQSFFGDGRLYLEKYIQRPRHIEFQILGDRHGTVVHLFERECSLQRRHQKLLEESPSPFLTPKKRAEMGDAAVRLAKAAGYYGVGTVEFLAAADGQYYFMEMNPRIQVEHPVTELVTGIDLVSEQIRVALGAPLGYSQEDIVLRGHAMECRVNAEDPDHGFAPRPGTIQGLHVPGGPGVRVDSAIYQGYTVPPYYDSLLAKLIVHAHDRTGALTRMKRAMAEFLVDGIVTNCDFHLRLLGLDAFRDGDYSVDTVEEMF
ncbi:MAG: acetyl-CoA carboxylase biotin carboxylase subunit [Oscillospiraceae bacterium]|jgi:acetyl-CoA carboxylase biotin carboxylase subunit|nr:acetyl-CoA carboxylase biotin carboxylase subunit [Oscillospiraceae bacterium]